MRLLELSLTNIGPFDQARVEFLADAEARPPVTFITGENGTGKSIIIDAIRGLFGPQYALLERRLWRDEQPFSLEMKIVDEGQVQTLTRSAKGEGNQLSISTVPRLNVLPSRIGDGPPFTAPHWIVDFWRPQSANDAYDIKYPVAPDHRSFLKGALQGNLRNAQVTELICHFDYLRGSADPVERETGEVLYQLTARIIQSSLLDGHFVHVKRASLTPIIKQSGYEVPLANASSGNAYLINRLVGLLGKLYSVHVLRQTPIHDLCKIPGLLLIDEAETHLHPRWQKRLIHLILGVFPNLQIIATTHSPFVVSSMPGARVYVCRYRRGTCEVEEESANYSAMPVDEILLSEAFDETPPFNAEMTELLQRRKQAIVSGDPALRRRLEAQLQQRNPEYFSYFDLDQRLGAILGGQ